LSALLVCVLCFAQGQPAPSKEAAPGPLVVGTAVAAQVLTPLEAASGATRPGAARIGQPIEWRIHVDGAALGRDSDERAREHELEALGWVMLDGPVYDGDSARRYTLMALDPGQRTTLELQLALADGGVAVAPAATLEVLGELAEGEDEPRPARGFRAVEDSTVLSPGALGGALGALVLAAGGVFLLVRLRRRVVTPAATGPTAAERLAALSPELDPLVLVAALGPLVRQLVDEATGEERAALTDEEWRARLTPPTGSNGAQGFVVAPELAARAASIVERSAEARFAGRAPSVLGAKELLAMSRALERDLETANQRGFAASGAPRGFAVSVAHADARTKDVALPRVERDSAEGGGA
jgi:hypothetical protein